MNSQLSKFGTLAGLILLVAFSRVLPHPPHFTPIGALALFGAAYFNRKSLAFVVPMSAMFLSDLVLGNPSSVAYICFILITIFGIYFLQKISIQRIILASLIASISFFLITNCVAWYGSSLYPQNFQGLLASYVAGLAFYQPAPFGNFFLNTVMGDLFFCGVLFGSYHLIQKYILKPAVA